MTWWHEGSLLDDVSEETRGQVTWNTLTLPDLTRQHLHRIITCQASNSNLTQPLRSSVTLDMSCEYRRGAFQTLNISTNASLPIAHNVIVVRIFMINMYIPLLNQALIQHKHEITSLYLMSRIKYRHVYNTNTSYLEHDVTDPSKLILVRDFPRAYPTSKRVTQYPRHHRSHALIP